MQFIDKCDASNSFGHDAGTFLIHPDMLADVTFGSRSEGISDTRQVRLGDFPANTVEYWLRYGIQRAHNDKLGGSDSTMAQKRAACDELMARFRDGVTGRVARERVEPLQFELRDILRANLRAKNKQAWKAFKALEPDDRNDRLDELLLEIEESQPEAYAAMVELANESLAEKAKLAAKKAKIDLSGLVL